MSIDLWVPISRTKGRLPPIPYEQAKPMIQDEDITCIQRQDMTLIETRTGRWPMSNPQPGTYIIHGPDGHTITLTVTEDKK